MANNRVGAPQDRPEPTPRQELISAARLLAKSLPDEVVESIREPWGSTNVAVIKHWRDETLRLIGEVAVPARAHQEETTDENEKSVSRVVGERLSATAGTTAKTSNGDK